MDLMSTKTGPNRREHHTDLFHSSDLIVRRGQTFQIELDLSRPFNHHTDTDRVRKQAGRLAGQTGTGLHR